MTDDPRRPPLHLVGGTDVTLEPLVQRNDIDLPEPPREVQVIRVRVSLDEATPPIWRQLELRGDLTLDVIHEVLQTAMGWTDSHLHRFQPGPSERRWEGPYFLTDWDVPRQRDGGPAGGRTGPDEEGSRVGYIEEGEEGTHERDARLDQVVHTTGDRLCYVYDFGDDWSHSIAVESVRAATDDDAPAVCVGGSNACPPEDVGGIHTYNELAAALRGEPHDVDDLDGYLTWLPKGFDPDHFDPDETNELLAMRLAQAEQVHRMLAPGAPVPPRIGAILRRLDPRSVHAFAAVTPLGDLVESPDADPAVVSRTVRPWRLLLDQAGETGIVLTAAGYLKPALVSTLFTELGMDRWWIGMGNREDQTWPVMLLRESAQQMGLLRKHKGKLLPTRRGQAVAADDHALWEAVAAGLVTHRDQWTQDACTLYLLHLADGLPTGSHTDIAEAMTMLGWRRDGVTPLTPGDVRGLTADLTSLLLLAGGLTRVAGGEQEATEAGRAFARAAVMSEPR